MPTFPSKTTDGAGQRGAEMTGTTAANTRVAPSSCPRDAAADGHLLGPHTSTLRMNPYVRCVHDSGVPEIRSLQELLAQRVQPDPAEPDTPCLRPSHGPASVWGHASAASPTFREEFAEVGSGAAHAHPAWAAAALGATVAHPSAATAAAAAAAAGGPVPSPVLAFTSDSVATPNTFATVRTHEKRILSHLSRRLRRSQRHQDMPLGEPMEMMLGDVEDEETSGEEADVAAEGADVGERPEVDMDSIGGDRHGACAPWPDRDAGVDDEDEAAAPLLPCSTKDKAEAAAALQPRSAPMACTTTAAAAAAAAALCNERIVSPHSSTRVFCAFADGSNPAAASPTAPASAQSSTTSNPAHHVHHPSQQVQRRSPPHEAAGAARHGSQQSQPHTAPSSHRAAGTAAAPLRVTYSAPVARLEESPYHYIMRNYIGGTFLYYSTPESKAYFLRLCHRVVAQVRPLLEQETLSPHHGLFPRINAPAFVFGDIHGNFEDLSFFLRRLLIFHDFNLTPANILCLGDYVDRGPFSLECIMLLFSLKIMNASKIVMLRGNHEDRVVCGDLRTYGRGCFLAQCHTVFGYVEGTKLFREVTALFKYLPLAAELVIPSAPNLSYLRAQQTVMHPNLYVSQPAVLLHDENRAPRRPASSASLTSDSTSPRLPAFDTPLAGALQRDGEVASGDEDSDEARSRNSVSTTPQQQQQHPQQAQAQFDTAEASMLTGYSTIADASLARGQPTRHEAHEERILCTHGGIPRFDRPPLEENSLAFLRSLSFPRMLTLFPNNPVVKDDAECAPDYFVKHELEALWRRYPTSAPPGFTAACRREAAAAAASAAVAAAGATAGGGSGGGGVIAVSTARASSSRVSSPTSVRLQKNASSSSSLGGSSDSVCSADDAALTATQPVALEVLAASARVPSTATAGARSATELHAEQPAQPSAAQPHTQAATAPSAASAAPAPARRSSSDYVPQLTEDDVRRGWFIMFDLLWSDPTTMELEEEEEAARAAAVAAAAAAGRDGIAPTAAASSEAAASHVRINEWGFGVNTRGSNVVSFSAKAVDTFLTAYHYSMLFRAHQEKAHGLRWCKSNKVLTIFSSSNYMGHRNGAGCVVVAANGEVQMIEKVVVM